MAPRGKPIMAKILMHTEYCCIFKEDQVLLVGRMGLQMIFATITLTELLIISFRFRSILSFVTQQAQHQHWPCFCCRSRLILPWIFLLSRTQLYNNVLRPHIKRVWYRGFPFSRPFGIWRWLRDLNPWPPAWQAGILTNWTKPPFTWALRQPTTSSSSSNQNYWCSVRL